MLSRRFKHIFQISNTFLQHEIDELKFIKQINLIYKTIYIISMFERHQIQNHPTQSISNILYILTRS